MPRYLVLIRVDGKKFTNQPSPAMMERMGGVMDAMREAGVMVAAEGLTPSSQGTTVRWEKRRLSTTDGPFAESKEAVGGFLLLKAGNKAEALEWVKRFAQLHEDEFDLACEVREIEGD